MSPTALHRDPVNSALMLTDRRLVALCSSVHLKNWIEAEVSGLVSTRMFAADIDTLIRSLTRGGASSSELVVLDLDLLSPPQTVGLKLGIEERWWNGTIVAIGTQRSIHRRYLKIDHTIGRPLGSEALRAVIERPADDDTHPTIDPAVSKWKRSRVR